MYADQGYVFTAHIMRAYEHPDAVQVEIKTTMSKLRVFVQHYLCRVGPIVSIFGFEGCSVI